MSATLGQAKATRIAESLNISSSDTRFVQYVNEAEQRMLQMGNYWGSTGRYVVNISSQILTMPPNIATPQSISMGGMVLDLRNLWFEFISNGYGPRDDTYPDPLNECLLRGAFPVLQDIPTPTKLKLFCDLSSDVGKAVILQGVDDSGNIIRSNVSGTWINGEQVLLAQSPGTTTANIFSRVTAVNAPTNLNGQWWMYDNAQTTLYGRYQYWDVSPSWKRYLIPFIANGATSVEIIGKNAFIPVQNDNDQLPIGNIAALKLACMAIKAEEEHSWDEANILWNGAPDASGKNTRSSVKQELENELAHQVGDGVRFSVNIQNAPGHLDPVPTLI